MREHNNYQLASVEPVSSEITGPHPSFIQVAKPFVFEHKIRECLKTIGVNEIKEDQIRLQGVGWIDNVRKALQL